MEIRDVLGTTCGIVATLVGYFYFDLFFGKPGAGFIPGVIVGILGYGLGFGIGYLIEHAVGDEHQGAESPDLRPRRPEED